jgi:hypothetical protein
MGIGRSNALLFDRMDTAGVPHIENQLRGQVTRDLCPVCFGARGRPAKHLTHAFNSAIRALSEPSPEGTDPGLGRPDGVFRVLLRIGI